MIFLFSATNIYAWLTPLAIFFILLEIGFCLYYKKKYISFPEAIANFGTALGNQTVNVLVAAGVYETYGWLWKNHRFIDNIPVTWYNLLFLLLGIDFIFYWVHRWGHSLNIMWAAHSPHHSAQEMNFFVATRASVTQRLVSFLFFWPLTLIGFEPHLLYIMVAIHLFIAFLHHTELVGKFWNWIEFIFTTPSHHRVHHGANYKYLDKNYGEFLIIWDRMFGSYAEETDKVVYGMYNHPNTSNPIAINFHYYRLLWKDAVATKSWWDKIRLWFMPLGWRPADLPPKPRQPEMTVENPQHYSCVPYSHSKLYLILSTVFGAALMLLIISANSPWSVVEKIIGSILLWHLIINWGGILDARKWVFLSEMIRIPITVTAIIIFSHLIDKPVYFTALIVYHLFCLYWTARFFRINNAEMNYQAE